MSEEKKNIKWETDIMELPDDVSFEGCRGRLIRSDEYKSDKLLAYDCWKIASYAAADPRLAGDVLEMYNILLEKGVSEEVKSSICTSLGEIVHFNPELRDRVVEFGVKHHPLFEKNLENYNHLYTDEIESMQGDVKQRLQNKNKDILGNVKEKVGKANKYYKPSANKVNITVDDMDEKIMNICIERMRRKK